MTAPSPGNIRKYNDKIDALNKSALARDDETENILRETREARLGHRKSLKLGEELATQGPQGTQYLYRSMPDLTLQSQTLYSGGRIIVSPSPESKSNTILHQTIEGGVTKRPRSPGRARSASPRPATSKGVSVILNPREDTASPSSSLRQGVIIRSPHNKPASTRQSSPNRDNLPPPVTSLSSIPTYTWPQVPAHLSPYRRWSEGKILDSRSQSQERKFSEPTPGPQIIITDHDENSSPYNCSHTEAPPIANPKNLMQSYRVRQVSETPSSPESEVHSPSSPGSPGGSDCDQQNMQSLNSSTQLDLDLQLKDFLLSIEPTQVSGIPFDSPQESAAFFENTQVTGTSSNHTQTPIEYTQVSNIPILHTQVSGTSFDYTQGGGMSIHPQQVSEISGASIQLCGTSGNYLQQSEMPGGFTQVIGMSGGHTLVSDISGGHTQANVISGGQTQVSAMPDNHTHTSGMSGGDTQLNVVHSGHLHTSVISGSHTQPSSICGDQTQVSGMFGDQTRSLNSLLLLDPDIGDTLNSVQGENCKDGSDIEDLLQLVMK